jgi:chloride channel 3/4/5
MVDMPKSFMSYHSADERDDTDDTDLERQERHDTISSATPTSPTATFRPLRPNRASDNDLAHHNVTERSSLLGNTHNARSYASVPATVPGTPRPPYGVRQSSQLVTSTRMRHSRQGSISQNFSQRLVNALGDPPGAGRRDSTSGMQASKLSVFATDDRGWYNQFTSIDWLESV